MSSIYAALELGTTRTVLALGEMSPSGRLKVAAHAEIPSTGVRKSQILNIDQVSHSIRSVLREIEKKQMKADNYVTIANAYLVVSGQHVKADAIQSSVTVSGAKVTNDDVNAVSEALHSVALARDRELLELQEQAYGLDALEGISSPKGMSGGVLKLNAIQIHADRNRLNDARTAAANAHLEITEPLFAASCAGDEVLGEREKQSGALVLDFGGGSTGFAAYCDGYLAHAGVIGVGGDHVTNDIAQAFQTTQAQAEELKISAARAALSPDGGDERISLAGTTPLMETRTVSRKALDIVVNARMKELLGIIREHLEDADVLHRLRHGAVMVGAGAAMNGLDALVHRELGLSPRLGTPLHVDGFGQGVEAASFAAIAGALSYAHRNDDSKSFLQTIFGGFFK